MSTSMTPGTATGTPTGATSRSTFQDMWDTRPPRIPTKQGGNAHVAGVCEGMGVRYHIDPTLIRVAFAVLTFVGGGGGFFIYLLCWFTMPRFGMVTSPAQAVIRPKMQLDKWERRERDTGWGLLILLFIFFPSLSIGTAGIATVSSMGGVIVAAIIWWALHHRMPEPPAGLIAQQKPGAHGPSSVQSVSAASPYAPHSPYAPRSPYAPGDSAAGVENAQGAQGGQPGQVAQPAQGGQPGQVAHETLFLPPETATPNEPPITSSFTAPDGYPHPATGRTTPPSWDPLGTAPELWHLPDPGFEEQPYTPPKAKRKKLNRPLWFWIPVATALTILTFIALALISSLSSSIRFYNFYSGNPGGIGNISTTYEKGAELRAVHQRVGEIELDLTGVGQQESHQVLEVGNYVGRIDIELPTDVPVTVSCAVGAGQAHCPQGVVNPDAKGEAIQIDARQLVGEIVINQPKP